MESLIGFMLGIGVVMLIGMIIFMASMSKRLKACEWMIKGLESSIEGLDQESRSQIEKRSFDFERVYRDMDSRLDKLTAKLEKQIQDIVRIN